MNYVRFIFGWLVYRIKAAFWYMGLAFRLWFAIGLDRDFDHSKEENLAEEFKYPGKKTYRRHLGKPIDQST